MSLTDEDLLTLTASVTAEWGLASVPNIATLLGESLKMADLILEEKYPSVYLGELSGTTPKEILFCSLRKLLGIDLLFRANPHFLNDFVRSKNLASISNPDAGSVNYFSQYSADSNKLFSLANIHKQISSIMISLGIAESSDPQVVITVNSLLD